MEHALAKIIFHKFIWYEHQNDLEKNGLKNYSTIDSNQEDFKFLEGITFKNDFLEYILQCIYSINFLKFFKDM